MAPDLLTYVDAATALGGVGISTVRRLVRAGKLRAYAIAPRCHRIDGASVRAYLRQSLIQPSAPVCQSGKIEIRGATASCAAATSLRAALERAKKR